MKDKFSKMATYFLFLAVECMLYSIITDSKKEPKCDKEIEDLWKKSK